MERCRESDFVGLTLTIDVPKQGNRERDIRTGMTIPPKINFSTFLRFVLSPLWSSNYLLSKEFQSVIPSTNIMYPVTNIKDLPEAFDKLDVPNFIQMDPKEINKNKEKWIDEWLNAS